MGRTACLLLLLLSPAGASAANRYDEAERLVDAGRFIEGASAYERFLTEQPASSLRSAASLAAAWAYLHANFPDSAELVLTRVPEEEYARVRELYLHTRAMIAYRAGRHAEAVGEFERLERDYPGSSLIRAAATPHSTALSRLRRHEEALAKLGDIDPANIDAVRARYEIQIARKDYFAAITALEALMKFPEEETDENFYQVVLLKERAGVSTLESLLEYRRRYPEGSHAGSANRILARSESHPLLRRELLRAAVKLETQEPFAAENKIAFAELSLELGDTRAAVREWKAVIRRHTSSPEAMNAIRLLRRTLGDLPLGDASFVAILAGMIADRKTELEDYSALDDAIFLVNNTGQAFQPLSAAKTSQPIPDFPVETATKTFAIPTPDAMPATPPFLEVNLPDRPRPVLQKPVRIFIAPFMGRSRDEDLLKPLLFWLRQKARARGIIVVRYTAGMNVTAREADILLNIRSKGLPEFELEFEYTGHDYRESHPFLLRVESDAEIQDLAEELIRYLP